MLGFSKPFAGQTVSLYIDADPSGPPAELAADILRGGRFAPVNLISDTSYGLTESGLVTLAGGTMTDPSPKTRNLDGAGGVRSRAVRVISLRFRRLSAIRCWTLRHVTWAL